MLLLDASKFDFSWRGLHIKPLGEADLQLYLDLYTNARVMRYICEPLTVDQAKTSFYTALSLNEDLHSERLFLTVRTENSEHAVALCCISRLDRHNKIAELGTMVLPQFHGKRVGQDATIALMRRIQQVLAITEFELAIHKQNLPAIRAAKLLGFKLDPVDQTLYRCVKATDCRIDVGVTVFKCDREQLAKGNEFEYKQIENI